MQRAGAIEPATAVTLHPSMLMRVADKTSEQCYGEIPVFGCNIQGKIFIR